MSDQDMLRGHWQEAGERWKAVGSYPTWSRGNADAS